MSVSYLPEKVKMRLWGKAAGRCQYEGCNTPLWLDTLTKAQFNVAYIAHIIADSPKGPRGDTELSKCLKSDISNLMLMCDKHHRLIDKEDIEGHPVKRLREMKKSHEHRIAIVSEISEEKQSNVLLYGANIGAQNSPLSFNQAASAMLPDWYPAQERPISISMKWEGKDHQKNYWKVEAKNLKENFNQRIKPLIKEDDPCHFSIFVFAPMPLMVLLGSLITDKTPAEVYQLHREPSTWRWLKGPKSFKFKIKSPRIYKYPPVLVISLSAAINLERVRLILGKKVSIWELTIEKPHNDFLCSKNQLSLYRKTVRKLMVEINKKCGNSKPLSIFPAMPIACAVELGRVRMPKADNLWVLYDHNNEKDAFIKTLTIGGKK